MIPKKNIFYLLSALVVCFLVMGIPYWLIPYSSLSLPNALYDIGLALVVAGALAFHVSGLGFLQSAVSFGCIAPAVVATRIILDTARDGSTHNLFPFEIAIAVFVGFVAAAFGAVIGMVIRRLLYRDHRDEET